MTENEITGDILDAAIKIHRKFGPGMLESVYERLLEAELLKRGHSVERQKSVSFEYEGMTLEDAFRVDLLVDERIVVELKAVEKMNPLFLKQVKTYLVAMNLPLGVLVNFGMEKLVDGYVRVVNGFDESSSHSTPLPRSTQSISALSASPRLCVSQKRRRRAKRRTLCPLNLTPLSTQ